MSWLVLQGDALERLRGLASGSVQCCITSPPFYGLRDYGTGEWEGGDPGCDHRSPTMRQGRNEDRPKLAGSAATNSAQLLLAQRSLCGKCGARRVDRQLGLEATPGEYVARLVEVFREVRRVLRDDGTAWINLGDGYAGKQLLGMPWRVAFALQQGGWFLRSDIVWSKKPNPMPESVTDRPTSAHEHVFLLAKSRTYLYDADAIREPHVEPGRVQVNSGVTYDAVGRERQKRAFVAGNENGYNPAGRNRRNVWTIATQPYPEAHFATFPTGLVEPMVLAGSSPKACGVCGAPWKRVMERRVSLTDPGRSAASKVQSDDPSLVSASSLAARTATRRLGQAYQDQLDANPLLTTGWQPSCSHDDDTGRSVILDPFAGSGTVGVVARWHGRDFIGIELNAEYVGMAERRIASEGVLGRRARRDCRDDGHPSLFDDGEGLVLGAG